MMEGRESTGTGAAAPTPDPALSLLSRISTCLGTPSSRASAMLHTQGADTQVTQGADTQVT